MRIGRRRKEQANKNRKKEQKIVEDKKIKQTGEQWQKSIAKNHSSYDECKEKTIISLH